MEPADIAFVYFDEKTLMQKNRSLEAMEVMENFGPGIKVITDSALLQQEIYTMVAGEPSVLLLMSSGTFGGVQWKFSQ